MTEEEWHRFVWGCDPQIVTIGELPRDLWLAIGSSSPLIRMEHYYARKCAFKHNFDSYHFPMLSITIEIGRCVLERPGCLSFFCFDPVIFGKWFQVALKTDQRTKTEVWVTTFHISRPSEVARITRKGSTLRTEKE